MTLNELPLDTDAKIISLSGDAEIRKRLLQLGFLEGSIIRVVHEAPWTKDPIGVRIQDTTIALRRSEAATIEVEKK